MQHLNEMELARLADEEPSADEAVHLSICEQCRCELEEFQAQLEELTGLPELHPAGASWDRLRERLAEEELVGRKGSQIGWRWLGGVAAALALFLGGAATGAAVVRQNASPTQTVSLPGTPAERVQTVATLPVAESPPAVDAPVSRPVMAMTASERLREAETHYLVALEEYSLAHPPAVAADPLNRLAALEGIVLTTRAALEEAPTDPVINGYLMSAIGQREAILRQINTAPPQDDEEDGWY